MPAASCCLIPNQLRTWGCQAGLCAAWAGCGNDDWGRCSARGICSPLLKRQWCLPQVVLGGGQSAASVTTTAAQAGGFEARFFHKVRSSFGLAPRVSGRTMQDFCRSGSSKGGPDLLVRVADLHGGVRAGARSLRADQHRRVPPRRKRLRLRCASPANTSDQRYHRQMPTGRGLEKHTELLYLASSQR